MTTTSEEEALAVLREIHASVAPDLPFRLVEDCYRIERRYQYERDPDLRLDALHRAVTVAVEDALREEGTGSSS